MWLYFVIVALVLAAIFGSIFAGTIFTIILVPLAVIAIASWIAYSLIAGSAQLAEGSERRPRRGPATRTRQTGSSAGPSSPAELADARRARQ